MEEESYGIFNFPPQRGKNAGAIRKKVYIRLFALIVLIGILLCATTFLIVNAFLGNFYGEFWIIFLFYLITGFILTFPVTSVFIAWRQGIEYDLWVQLMDLRYPEGWDEMHYGFAPFFDHEDHPNRGEVIDSDHRLKTHKNGLVGPFNFMYKYLRPGFSARQFVPWDEIETITNYKSKYKRGGLIIVETKDLKIGSIYDLDDIEHILKTLLLWQSKIGERWGEIYKGEIGLEKNNLFNCRRHHYINEIMNK
jgi:hypothetical protein